jgi:hypothetical protein
MSADFVFPPGVITSTPFHSLPEAAAWLAAAAESDALDAVAFGGFSGYHFRSAKTPPPPYWDMTPILDAATPTVLVVMPDPAYEVGNSMDSPAPYLVPVVEGATERQAPAVAAFYFDPAPPFYVTAPDLFGLWRQLAGWKGNVRRGFDTAPDSAGRHAIAPTLGFFERALDATAGHFVDAANRWVSTVWVDAINAGLDVWPPRPESPSSQSINPAGAVRLGST